MIDYQPKSWGKTLYSFRGTVLPHIAWRLTILTVFTGIMCTIDALFRESTKVAFFTLNTTGHSLIGVALGLLVVFRTNTSYDRFWEGRKLWGTLVNTCRSIMRCSVVYLHAGQPMGNYLCAYVSALKQHLRGVRNYEEIRGFLPADLYAQVAVTPNPPSFLALSMSQEIYAGVRNGQLPAPLAAELERLVVLLLDCQGGCERILKTPIPFTYAVHIRHMLTLYLLTLPFTLVPVMGWAAVLAVPAIGFGLLGIEEAGVEIENPFGFDPNDLPLENICTTIHQNMKELDVAHPGAIN
jgi:putative membrane protein